MRTRCRVIRFISRSASRYESAAMVSTSAQPTIITLSSVSKIIATFRGSFLRTYVVFCPAFRLS